jgi:hypothetical protein
MPIDTTRNATEILQAVERLAGALTGSGSEELRVALVSDLLNGDLNVNLNGQSGDVEVALSSDSLTGSLDVDVAEVSAGTLTVTDDGALDVNSLPSITIGTDNVGVAKETTLSSVDSALNSLAGALDGDVFEVEGDVLRTVVENDSEPPPFPDVGQLTVSTAGSPEALVSQSAPVASGVKVKALPTNASATHVWVTGGSKSQAYVLAAGDEVFVPIDDASKIILDVDTGGDGVSFIAA